MKKIKFKEISFLSLMILISFLLVTPKYGHAQENMDDDDLDEETFQIPSAPPQSNLPPSFIPSEEGSITGMPELIDSDEFVD